SMSSNSIGKVLSLYVGTQKGIGKTPIDRVELIADHGVNGDIHAGRDPKRQVSLIASEVLSNLAGQDINYSAGDLSSNLLTENIPLDSLEPGTQLKIGSAVLEIVEARKPCGTLTKLDKRLPKLLYRRCGQLARVVKGGTIQAGLTIEVLK
ncbi:MAG TPA: MOSC domain-containing protein, partial [Blastocatellia bacterium]|nr:MOSC domain-containing protein [Blastocatellia bacterium]